MAFKFSQNLRDKLIEYFWKCHNLTISEDQADEYLDSLADLFIVFNSMREDTTRPQGAWRLPHYLTRL